jgi:hypothetical protein
MSAPITRVGDPLKAILVLADLQPLLGVTLARLYQLEAEGAFAFAELKPRVGTRPRYSGKRIQAWIDGEEAAYLPATRHFGAGRAR